MKIGAFTTGPFTYLDHLCPLSAQMQFPLIVWDEVNYAFAKKFYPQTEVVEISPLEATGAFFSENFHLIFHTNQFFNLSMGQRASWEGSHTLKTVFCPHGNSDKKYSLSLSDYPIEQDFALIYGDHMKNHLIYKGAYPKIKHPVITGNFRLEFYKKYSQLYKSLLHERTSSLDPKKKTIFYAPTWPDGENPTSFFSEAIDLAKALHQDFNIIIKQHPFLEQNDPARAYYIKSQYEQLDSVLTLDDFPAIYPILDFADIYIGDFSSIGYDFLAFNKPMYFFNPTNLDPATCRGAHLHTCGLPITPEAKAHYSSFLQDTLLHNQNDFEEKRGQVYEYAFAKPKDPLEILQEIQAAL